MRSGKSFAEVVLLLTLVYRVEQVFLIHRESGIVLMHVAEEGSLVQDPDLVSGMLTAIQDFVNDSFQKGLGEGLDTLRMGGDHSVWIEHGPVVFLSAVIRCTPPLDYRDRIGDVMREIHQNYGSLLDNFDEDLSVFAVDPKSLWANTALSAKGLESRWETYHCLGADFVLKRAYGVLHPPPGVKFRLINDTLRAKGDASHRWICRSRRQALSLPGVLVYDDSGIKNIDYRILQQTASELEGCCITFDIGDARIRADRREMVQLVGESVKKIQSLSGAVGTTAHIDIFGHTDRTGPESLNRQLSRTRADTVFTYL